MKLPKFISDVLFPEYTPPPTALVNAYRAEVDKILDAVNVPHFKVSDNTEVSSLFYTNEYAGVARFEPRTYSVREMQDKKMDALNAFSAVTKLFEGVCIVELDDKLVDLAKKLHERSLTTA